MKKQKDNIIAFSGLSLGRHEFTFEIENSFFDAFEYSEIQECAVKVDIMLNKTERMLELDLHFEGNITLPCDRCLDPVAIPVNTDEKLYVRFGLEDGDTSDDNVWILGEHDTQLDLSPFIYDSIALAKPLHVVHPDDADGNSTCNPEMLKHLGQMEAGENQSTDEIDPRWEALKELKIKK